MLCYNQTDNTVIENLYKKLYFCSFQIKADFFYNDNSDESYEKFTLYIEYVNENNKVGINCYSKNRSDGDFASNILNNNGKKESYMYYTNAPSWLKKIANKSLDWQPIFDILSEKKSLKEILSYFKIIKNNSNIFEAEFFSKNKETFHIIIEYNDGFSIKIKYGSKVYTFTHMNKV